MAKAYVNKRDKFLWDNSFKPEMSIPVPEVSDVGKAVVVDADGDYTLGNVSVEDEIVYFKIDAQGENLIDCTMSQIKAALDDSKTVCLIRINGTTKFILPLFVYVPLTNSVNYAEFTNCKPGTYISRRRVNYETVKLDFANNTITYTDESGYISQDYSTTEHVVGTWIDGKPIYQKTFITTVIIPNKNTWYNADDVTDLHIESLVHFESTFGNNEYSICTNLVCGRIDNNHIQVLSMEPWGINSYTIQYTKTTD